MALTEQTSWGRLEYYVDDSVKIKKEIIIYKDSVEYISENITNDFIPGSDISSLPGKLIAIITAGWSYSP